MALLVDQDWLANVVQMDLLVHPAHLDPPVLKELLVLMALLVSTELQEPLAKTVSMDYPDLEDLKANRVHLV